MSIAVEVHGSGDPILFIHGLGGTTNLFGPQVATLSRTHSCIRFDLPGAGRSALTGSVSMDGFVQAALEVLASNAGTGPVHVVAHSMGTIVAQHLAITSPERVRSLSLVGPIHAPSEPARKGLRDRAARARAEGMTGIADDVVAAGLSADTKAHRPEIAAAVREFLMRQQAEGYASHCEALAQAQPADLASIKAPVLLITGDEDNTAPPRAVKAIQSACKTATFTLLAPCGHWAPLEHPFQVTARILDFLLSAP